jgi:hypothetical protein
MTPPIKSVEASNSKTSANTQPNAEPKQSPVINMADAFFEKQYREPANPNIITPNSIHSFAQKVVDTKTDAGMTCSDNEKGDCQFSDGSKMSVFTNAVNYNEPNGDYVKMTLEKDKSHEDHGIEIHDGDEIETSHLTYDYTKSSPSISTKQTDKIGEAYWEQCHTDKIQ